MGPTSSVGEEIESAGRRSSGGARIRTERLKPPQQLRKAPQTAWGFNCVTAREHRPEECAGVPASERESAGRRSSGGARIRTERLKPPLGKRQAPSRLAALAERGFNCETALRCTHAGAARAVGAGRHCGVIAANSFAGRTGASHPATIPRPATTQLPNPAGHHGTRPCRTRRRRPTSRFRCRDFNRPVGDGVRGMNCIHPSQALTRGRAPGRRRRGAPAGGAA